MKSQKDTIFIISHYWANQDIGCLNKLISSLLLQKERADCAVVINIDNYNSNICNIENKSGILIIRRPNVGMNIAAWRHGYEALNSYDNYFFFQSECFIKRNDFLDAYLNLIQRKNVGLVGETLNLKWNYNWQLLEKSVLNSNFYDCPGDYSEKSQKDLHSNRRIRQRVTYYKNKLIKWGCPLGDSAIHLRSLNLAARREVLEKIDFPIGLTKHECIAAEIYISKKIQSIGLEILQSNSQPFEYIGHNEWKASGRSKIN